MFSHLFVLLFLFINNSFQHQNDDQLLFPQYKPIIRQNLQKPILMCGSWTVLTEELFEKIICEYYESRNIPLDILLFEKQFNFQSSE